MSEVIRVKGLDELHRALDNLEDGLDNAAAAASREATSDIASEARSVALSIGGVAAKTAPTIHADAGAKSSGVVFGGPEYAMGAAFGGQGRPTTQQFLPHLGTTGYFPYPTIRKHGGETEETFLEHVEDLLERVGLK